jgi:hypothetical protein
MPNDNDQKQAMQTNKQIVHQKILLDATNVWVQESPKLELQFRTYEGLKLID